MMETEIDQNFIKKILYNRLDILFNELETINQNSKNSKLQQRDGVSQEKKEK
ncbi:MAG: hypothetical protein ACFFDF_13215 [Candidatus Odinarchaeota archaeon]